MTTTIEPTTEKYVARNMLPLLSPKATWQVSDKFDNYGRYREVVETLLDVHKNANDAMATDITVDQWESARAVWEGFRVNGDYVELDSQLHKYADVMEIPLEIVGVAQSLAQAAPKKVLYHVSELHTMPPLRWIIRNELLDRGVSVICAPSQSGKSFITVDRVCRLALEGKRIVYVAPEGARGYKQRMRAWELHNKVDLSRCAIHFYAAPVLVMDRTQVVNFCETIKELNPDVVVLDTWLKCMIGGNVSDNADVSVALYNCEYILDTFDCSMLIVHHTNKSGKDLGAIALYNGVEVFMMLENHEGNLTLQYTKNKDDELADSKNYQTVRVTTDIPDVENGGFVTSLVLEPGTMPEQRHGDKLSNAQVTILSFLDMEIFNDSGASSTKIVNARGISESTLYNTLSALKKLGYVRQGQRGDPFYITDDGRSVLIRHLNSQSSKATTNQLPKSSSVVIRGRESSIDDLYSTTENGIPVSDAQLQLPKVLPNDYQSSNSTSPTTTLLSPSLKDGVVSSGVESSTEYRELIGAVVRLETKLDRIYDGVGTEVKSQYDKFQELLTRAMPGTPEYDRLARATEHYIEQGGEFAKLLQAHIDWSIASDKLDAMKNKGAV